MRLSLNVENHAGATPATGDFILNRGRKVYHYTGFDLLF
jgi:hypothetical protein